MKLIDEKVLSLRIRSIGAKLSVWRDDVTEVLVACSYQACRGNPNFANELLGVLMDGKASAINISCITRYLETFSPLVIRKERFEINKGARKTMGVESEDAFAPFEEEMRKASWWLMGKKQPVESIFDASVYLEDTFKRMSKKLNDEGAPELSKEVSALIKELYATNAWKEAVAARTASKEVPSPSEAAEPDPHADPAELEAAKERSSWLQAQREAIAAESAEAGAALLAST